MLQRIQSVFLFIAVLLMLLMTIFPVWVYQPENSDTVSVLTAFYFEQGGVKEFMPYTLIAVLAILSAIVGFIEIFKFKNRLLQMKLGTLNSLLMIGTLGLSFYFANELIEKFNLQLGWSYGMAVYFPPAAMLCNIMANRFIRKDEKLVRSVDRIR